MTKIAEPEAARCAAKETRKMRMICNAPKGMLNMVAVEAYSGEMKGLGGAVGASADVEE